MYKSISIKNFRCFEDITIEPFKRINLITGLNNAGKTSLLEALYLSRVPNKPEKLINISGLRGIEVFPNDADALWGDLFFKRNYKDNKITISCAEADNKKQTLDVYMCEEEFPETPLADKKQAVLFDTAERTLLNKIEFEFTDSGKRIHNSWAQIVDSEIKYEKAKIPEMKGHFASSRHKWLRDDADKFGKLVVKKQEGKILEILKHIEPRLESLTVIPRGGRGIMHGDIGMSELIPLPMMGGGINRLLSLALIISDTQDGVVLIDEIDSGLHYGEMENVWQSIHGLSEEYNVQIFSTTHSIECIRAAYQVFSKTNHYDFTLHRLDISDSKISSVYYDKETLEAAIETGLEIR